MTTTTTILRMDDPGASTKQFEQYAKLRFWGLRLPTPKILQVGLMKRLPLWRGWGPYPELSAAAWDEVLQLLRNHKAKMTVAVTACWVMRDASLVPFDEMWPEQAAILRGAAEEGLIEIANHGLTHCVVEGGHFLPHPYRSNRKYHREFGAQVPAPIQHEHLERAQEILARSFGKCPVTFVPPGNVWTEDTERAAAAVGLRFLTSHQALAPTGQNRNGLIFIGEEDTNAFHDREIALYGVQWLRRALDASAGQYKTVAERGEELVPFKTRPTTFVHHSSAVRNNLGVYIRSVGERTKSLCIAAVTQVIPPENVHLIEHVYPAVPAYERMFSDALKKKYRWFVGLDADLVLRENWLSLVEAQIEELTGHNWYVLSFSVQDPFLENISRGNHFYNGAYARRSLKVLQRTLNSLRPESMLRHFVHAQSPYIENEWIGYHGYDQYYRDIFYRFWIRALRSQTLRHPNPPTTSGSKANPFMDMVAAQTGWQAGRLSYMQQLQHRLFQSLSSVLPQTKNEREILFNTYLPQVIEKSPLLMDLATWHAAVEERHKANV